MDFLISKSDLGQPIAPMGDYNGKAIDSKEIATIFYRKESFEIKLAEIVQHQNAGLLKTAAALMSGSD